MARDLFVSDKTVTSHVSSLLRKHVQETGSISRALLRIRTDEMRYLRDIKCFTSLQWIKFIELSPFGSGNAYSAQGFRGSGGSDNGCGIRCARGPCRLPAHCVHHPGWADLRWAAVEHHV
ncbi:DNA-binding response regulator [Tessaracoccus antarcticus]|uniref:DNA-binding response regulator n=1 Tax=Tessaracoccus antarcticus TaxID=2479848 RepID=A0A3M0G7V0_9ACTN|nr:DNA-binding response regulator [Tessaracoccus antarcticus]